MARLWAVSSLQVKLSVTSRFKSKPIERNLARGSSLWNSPQTISHHWLLLTVLFANIKGQSFLNQFYCSCWKLSFRVQIPFHGEDAVRMRENWKCWVLQKLKYWANNFLLYFYESNPTASWWFSMLLVNKHLFLLSKRKRLIIQHWFLCVETEWSLFWCSIYRGLLMYLLRAANKAVIRARQLPQRNFSIPCLGWGVAEPSPESSPSSASQGSRSSAPWLTTAMLGAGHIHWDQKKAEQHPPWPVTSWAWASCGSWGGGTGGHRVPGTCELLVTPILGKQPALTVVQASQWSPSICKVLDILCLNIENPGLGCGGEGQGTVCWPQCVSCDLCYSRI